MNQPQRANIVHYCHPDDDMRALCDHPSPAMLVEPDPAVRLRVKATDVNAICSRCVDHIKGTW